MAARPARTPSAAAAPRSMPDRTPTTSSSTNAVQPTAGRSELPISELTKSTTITSSDHRWIIRWRCDAAEFASCHRPSLSVPKAGAADEVVRQEALAQLAVFAAAAVVAGEGCLLLVL